jgi:hypothetical protein
MSWQGMQAFTNRCLKANFTVIGWVDQTLVGSKKVDKAAIFSAAGDTLLATSAGFNVSFFFIYYS